MNREAGYLARGFLLTLVVLAGLGLVHFLTSIPAGRPAAEIIPNNVDAYRSQTNSIGIPVVFNERGKWLFNENCSSCHKPEKDCDVLDLQHVKDRVRDKVLLRGRIRNSDSVLKSGNAYYTKYFEVWGRMPMPAFPHLSDDDIDVMLEYLRWARR